MKTGLDIIKLLDLESGREVEGLFIRPGDRQKFLQSWTSYQILMTAMSSEGGETLLGSRDWDQGQKEEGASIQE